MSKANIIRTAFSTLAEAYLIESNKARRAELRALRTKHNIPGSNLTSAEIGHRAGRAVAAYKSPWTPAGSKGAHKGITDLAKKYGKQAKTNPNWSSQSSAELDQDADKTYRSVEKAEGGQPTSYTTGIKRGILTGRKIIKKAMGENTMNYRQSLRALFEAVIEEMHINESSAARKAAVRAKLAAAGHKQNRLYKTQVKPQFKDQPYSTLPSTAKMARRDAKKVRGQLDPHDEKGRISLDGKREYVFDKAADLSSQSKAGKMARGMKRDYQDADEEQRREDARNDAEWEETDRDLSNFFRGGRSRGMFK